MSSLKDAELTDRTDDFDFVLKRSGTTASSRMHYQTPDGEMRTDLWFSNYEEVTPSARTPKYDKGTSVTDPWVADTDADGLTDGQELGRITVVQSNGGILWDLELGRDRTSPTTADTDGDGAVDGGGYVTVGGAELGRQQVRRGEVWEIGSNPERADVVHILAAYDKEWVQHYDQPMAWVSDIIDRTNYYFNREFENYKKVNFYFEYNLVKYNSNDRLVEGTPEGPGKQLRSGVARVDWPRDDYDVLSLFSHQPMSKRPHNGLQYTSGAVVKDIQNTRYSKYADAVSQNGINNLTTLIGTFDPVRGQSAINLYQHEMGHVFGASHPAREVDGIMCKRKCDPGDQWMLTTHKFSKTNKEAIISRQSAVAKAHNRGQIQNRTSSSS